jgi:putative tryptophan/tyrosine transport system substrate-binding protein
MLRRAIGLLVTLALGLLCPPLAAEAQQSGHIPLVGVLHPGGAPDPLDPKDPINAFRQGLRDLGYLEGHTIRLAYRFADGQGDRLPALAAELVALRPDVIVTNATLGARAAQQATTTIPIVVAFATDLVEAGLVAGLARPGGNLTGQHSRDLEVLGELLELLKEAVPTMTSVAVLTNLTGNPRAPHFISAFDAAAQALGVRLQYVDAGGPEAFDAAFATIAISGAEALLIQNSFLFSVHRQRLLDFARAHRLPTVCNGRLYAEAGCLLTYSANSLQMYRRAAVFVDKILKGAKPGDLPVERPDTFELVVHLKTAQALGLTIPPTLLFRADEVIR